MNEFPIYGSDQDKFQYLQRRYNEARDSEDKEGQKFYNREIGKLFNGEELSNSEIKAREREETEETEERLEREETEERLERLERLEREERILREEIKKLNEKPENLAGKPYLEGVIQPKIQQLVKNPADFSMKNRSLQKEDQPKTAPTPEAEDQPHGVKIFLIIIYLFLIIGTIVMAALYFSYKEEWFLYIILGLLALLFILFIVLFYISFKNSE